MELTRACASDYVRVCVCVCVYVHIYMDIKNMCVCVCMVYVCACVCVLPLDEFFICTVIGMQSRYTSRMIIQVK